MTDAFHEHHVVDNVAHHAIERGRRIWALQRDQRMFVHVGERDIVVEVFAQMGDVVPFHRAVDDEVIRRIAPMAFGPGFFIALDPRRRIGDHEIVEDTAVLFHQQRIADLARLERSDRARKQLFEFFGRLVAGDHQLAHMADIEQPGLLAGPIVFDHDAFVLDRHVIARKGDHSRTLAAMPRIERQRFDFGNRVFGFVAQVPSLASMGAPLSGAPTTPCPLCRET